MCTSGPGSNIREACGLARGRINNRNKSLTEPPLSQGRPIFGEARIQSGSTDADGGADRVGAVDDRHGSREAASRGQTATKILQRGFSMFFSILQAKLAGFLIAS